MPELSKTEQKFILHWGEMGSKWGINRTVAMIHALLMLSPEALNAEEIAETLTIARSNVSTSLKELQGWGLIEVEKRFGDRRDYFNSDQEIWEMFRMIGRERKEREADPTVRVIRDCVAMEKKEKAMAPYSRKRMEEILEFCESMSMLWDQLEKLPTGQLRALARLGDKARSVLASVGKK